MAEDGHVPLGVRQNPHQAGLAKLGDYPLQRQVHVMREFQQHVAAPVGQGEHLAPANLRNQVRRDADIGPRTHFQLQAPLGQPVGQLDGPLANRLRPVACVYPQLVRGGHDRVDSVGQGDFGHGQGLGPGGCPVVQAGQDVAVDIHQRRD